MKKLILSLITCGLLGSSLFMISMQVSAHGYVIAPQSRSYQCFVRNYDNTPKTPTNPMEICGNGPRYYPQSIEALKNFPSSGPVDGKIASGGVGEFELLDKQEAGLWNKINIKTGLNTFTWYLTAAHATTNWRFFITKIGWDPNAPLTRASFDLTPFCQYDDEGKKPLLQVPINYQCTIPSDHTGYHVILATWDVYDTTNAFYQVIDVNLSN